LCRAGNCHEKIRTEEERKSRESEIEILRGLTSSLLAFLFWQRATEKHLIV